MEEKQITTRFIYNDYPVRIFKLTLNLILIYMLFLTICCDNYLSQAAELSISIKKTNPAHRLIVCLFEKNRDNVGELADFFDQIILAEELNIDLFDRFVFRHTQMEAATAIKADLFLWAFKKYGKEEYFIYLDPDIKVFNSFESIVKLFSTHSILVTPHHLEDEDTVEGIKDNMIRTLMCGTFNLGFIGIKRNRESLQFLKWWQNKLHLFCYIDFTRGLFVDQKWIDMAFSFFDIGVVRSAAYNVANWNISKRKLAFTQSGNITVNREPLLFFHFSKINIGKDLYYFKKYLEASNPVFKIREEYIRGINQRGHKIQSTKRWGYDYFDSGERISSEARYYYRNQPKLMELCIHPSSLSNETILSALAKPNPESALLATPFLLNDELIVMDSMKLIAKNSNSKFIAADIKKENTSKFGKNYFVELEKKKNNKPENLPLFVKLGHLSSNESWTNNAILMELHFYREYAASLKAILPKCILYKSIPGSYISIVLEDISHSHFCLSGYRELNLKIFKKIVESLAVLHSKFTGKIPNFYQDKPPLHQLLYDFPVNWSASKASILHQSPASLKNKLNKYFELISSHLVQNHVIDFFGHSKTGMTVVHGDCHFGNIMYPLKGSEQNVKLIDWQLSKKGFGIFDVAGLLIHWNVPKFRRSIETDVIKHYIREYNRRSSCQLEFRSVYAHYKISILYLAVESFFYWRSGKHSWANFENVFAAIEDHQVFDFIN